MRETEWRIDGNCLYNFYNYSIKLILFQNKKSKKTKKIKNTERKHKTSFTCNILSKPQFSDFITHITAAAAAAKSLQSCPPLCDTIDGSPLGSPVPGILQAKTREWVAISFSNAWKWKVKVKSLSRVRLLATPWTAAHRAPPSLQFSRQEYRSGVPLLSPTYNSR